jgi:hypothetical protein
VTEAWPRLLGYEVRRSGFRLVGRLALISVGAGLLLGFVSVLPAYQATFTAALESASFDIDLNGLFHPADLATIRNVPGVAAATPVFGMFGVPVTHGSRGEAAWVWAVEESPDLSMLPLNPSFVSAGRFDLGTSSSPSIVLDQELAATLAASPGDEVTLEANSQMLRARVSAVTGPAARLRGPSLMIARSVIEGLMPPEVRAEGAYTEVFIRGTVTPDALVAALPGSNIAVATKDEMIDLQRQQIEVSPPVIDVSSRLALVGLIGMLVLLAWQARERRKDLLNVARNIGSPRLSILLGYLLLEGLPTAVAAGIGSAVVLLVVVNGYFANIGVYVEPRAVLAITVVLVVGILLAHAASLAIPARALRAAR